MNPVQAAPVLEIRNLSVRRDGHLLVSDVSLDVLPGSIHFLVGPNGAGKTTVLAAVLGLAEFTGSIRIHPRQSGRIGYVPQRFVVDRTMPLTVADFLTLPRQSRPVCFGVAAATRQRVAELLVRVGLAGFESRQLGALSGGELQRMLFANAVDPVPELLLLDEPESGLDEIAVRQLEEVLLELRQASGVTTLMVSHDLDLVRRIGDRVTILDNGGARTGVLDQMLADNLKGGLKGGWA